MKFSTIKSKARITAFIAVLAAGGVAVVSTAGASGNLTRIQVIQNSAGTIESVIKGACPANFHSVTLQVNALRGPKGAKGATGSAGAPGAPGATGAARSTSEVITTPGLSANGVASAACPTGYFAIGGGGTSPTTGGAPVSSLHIRGASVR